MVYDRIDLDNRANKSKYFFDRAIESLVREHWLERDKPNHFSSNIDGSKTQNVLYPFNDRYIHLAAYTHIGGSLEVGVQGDILNIQKLERMSHSGLPFGKVYDQARIEYIPGLRSPVIIPFNKSSDLANILIDGIMKVKK